MIIKIDPLDTLFFRDGKPFNMGDDTWADAVFPPFPSVIYGALRSAYFAEHIDELGKAADKEDPTKDLIIRGIYIRIGEDVYVPLPLDCVKTKEWGNNKNNDNKNKVFSLSPIKNHNLTSTCPTEFVLKPKEDKEVENEPNGLIRISMLKKHLSQSEDDFSIQKLDDYVLSEPKIGIAIDSMTGSSEEGKLYRVDMKRLGNKSGVLISLIVDFKGINLSEKGLIKLGGEGKAVSYEKCSKDLSIDVIIPTENRFKIYLSTPAIFKKGWLPEWIDEKTLIGEYSGLKLKLITTAIGKPIHIGGFDMKKRKPKPMYKAVPAGSVYYFKIIKGAVQDVIDAFHGKSISDYYKEQGFGIAYVGKIMGGRNI